MSCRVYNLFSALMLKPQVSKREVFLTMFLCNVQQTKYHSAYIQVYMFTVSI